MFNKKLIDVLTQVNGITNSIILKYPNTVAISESKDMLVSIDVAAIDADEFPDIGIMDYFSDMLALFKLFPEERDVLIDANTISISSKETSACYITDNIALMDAFNKDQSQFSKTELVPSVGTFDLNVSDIKQIKSASGVFKDLSEVIFKSQDDEMRISLGATNKFNAKSNTFSVSKSGSFTKEFEIKIPVENFKMLPLSDYEMGIKYNSERDSYRILLKNKSLEALQIIMSVKI